MKECQVRAESPGMREAALDRGNFKGRLIPLDFKDLLTAALRGTGLEYSFDRQCEEPLKVLLDSCTDEAALSMIGRLALRQHLLELLKTRFQLLDYWQRTPEIQKQQIHPPIFITGMPKSASTFLHRLLSQDADNRAPRMWEVMYPLPAPACSSLDADPRIKKTDNRLLWLRWTHPALVKAHPVGARIPQECGAILGYSLESSVFLDMFSLPSYESWLRRRDSGEAYGFHLKFLKHLQWQCPAAKRWVLKSSDHLYALETMLKVYPGAKVIFLHRYPLKVLQAASSQMVLLKSVFSRGVDRRQLGAYEARCLVDKTRKMMTFRDNHVHLEDQFIDVRYQDLAADPIGTVRAIYRRFGFALSAESESRMKAFADAERNKRRSDRFSLADFDLASPLPACPFDSYCQRFRVEREEL
jgi:hypothetical protein